jgi:hypothetical protein
MAVPKRFKFKSKFKKYTTNVVFEPFNNFRFLKRVNIFINDHKYIYRPNYKYKPNYNYKEEYNYK